MKSETKNFSSFDTLKAIWYFLEEDKGKFIFFFTLLSTVLFYNLVPPYIVGKIVDFFTAYTIGDSLRTFYSYIIFLGITYIIASAIRLFSKQTLVIFGQKARTRARTWGFERLTEFSLEWHNKENTGDKLQRIFTGADSLRSFTDILCEKMLGVLINTTGALIVFIFVDVKLAVFIFF